MCREEGLRRGRGVIGSKVSEDLGGAELELQAEV